MLTRIEPVHAAEESGRGGGLVQAPPPGQGGLPPEELRRRAGHSRRMMAALGAIATVQMRSSGHRQRTLADLEAIGVPAVARGQYAVAEAVHKQQGFLTPVAYLVWASVSAEIDQRLLSGAIAPATIQEWSSGDIIWLMDAAGDQRQIDELVGRQLQDRFRGRTVRVVGVDGGGNRTVTTLRESSGT